VSLSALALLVTLAPTALDVRLEEARGVTPAEAEVLVGRLRERAARVTGSGALRVRALATPGALRLTLVWTGAARPTLARATLVGPAEGWAPALDEALATLGLQQAEPAAEPDGRGPRPAPPPPPSASPGGDRDPKRVLPATDEPAALPVLGLSLLGTGVVAGAAAVVLGVMNQAARDEGNPLPAGRARDALDERTMATGLGANVLWGVAAVALATGGWLVLSED
jgi:hypothetical protein